MHPEDEKAITDWLKETQKGYIRIAVLILLSKKPCHGYDMMKEVRERTLGFWRPTAGGVYPILRNLEESGYVKGEWDTQRKRKRKIYQITKAGSAVLERALVKESQVATNMSNLFKEYMKDVLDVRVSSVQIPRLPNLFSLFLEERKEKPEDTIKILEGKRAQLEAMIKELQEQREGIDTRLLKLEESRRKTENKRK